MVRFSRPRLRPALLYLATAWLVTTMVSSAAAHPGHGHLTAPESPSHYLLEPVHNLAWLPLLLMVALICLVARAVYRSS